MKVILWILGISFLLALSLGLTMLIVKFRSLSSSATRQSVCLETLGPGSRRAPLAPVHRGSGGLALGQPLPWIMGRGRAEGGAGRT